MSHPMKEHLTAIHNAVHSGTHDVPAIDAALKVLNDHFESEKLQEGQVPDAVPEPPAPVA